MSFSQTAASSIVPTLARIVLGLAFVTIGANKFQETTFDAAAATTLRDLGVEMTPVGAEPEPEPAEALAPSSRSVRFASLQSAAPSATPVDPAPPVAPRAEADDDAAPRADDAEVAAPPADPLPDGEYTARSLHRITLLCHDAGWTHDSIALPVILAWVAALTELVGGAMILIGLLSRLWGLGLAGAMGTAFYLVSMGKYGVHTQSPFAFAQDIGHYNTVCAQLALGVLAFGIVLTGAGPLSLDRLLFGRGRAKPEIDDDAGFTPAPAPVAPPPAPAPPVPAPAPPTPMTPSGSATPAPPPSDVPMAEDPPAPPPPPARDDEPMPPPSAGGRPL